MVNGEESAATVVVDSSDSILPNNIVATSDGMVTVTLAAGEEGTPLAVSSIANPLATTLATVTDSEAAAQQLLTLITNVNSNHVLLTSTASTLSEQQPASSATVSTVTAPSLPSFLPFMQPPTVSFVSGDSSVIVPSTGGEGSLASSTVDREEPVLLLSGEQEDRELVQVSPVAMSEPSTVVTETADIADTKA